MNTQQALENVLTTIAKNHHWPTPAEWTRYHLNELSLSIAQKTGVSISIDTLRRLAGQKEKSNHYDPQQATKEALAKYLDYASWEDFKTNIAPNHTAETTQETPKSTAQISKKRKINLKLLLRDATFLLVIASGAWWAINYFYESPTHILHYFIVSKNNGYAPQTISVAYERNPDFNDSLYIIWPGNEWKEAEKTPLYLPKDTLYYTFQIPDVYNISIFNTIKKIDSARVVLASKGWCSFAYIKNSLHFPLQPIIENQKIKIDTANLTKYFYPLDNVYADLRLIQPNTFSGENFEVSFLVKQYHPAKPYFCRTFSVKLPFENGNIHIQFNSKGCRALTYIEIGGHLIEGKWHDLSVLEDDFVLPKNITIKNTGGTLQLIINSAIGFETKHTEKLGSSQGIVFCFQGAGEVENIMWSTPTPL